MPRPQHKDIPTCRICEVLLTIINWFKADRERPRYICKNCHKNYARSWKRRFSLRHYVQGKLIKLRGIKRPYPRNGRCEICNNKHKRMPYHHWDDKDISKGIYLCHRCHWIAEGIDHINSEEGKEYIRLKQEIDDAKKI